MKAPRHFLSITDLNSTEILKVLKLALKLKKTLRQDFDDELSRIAQGKPLRLLFGKTLVMIFEKPSLRTRLSFEIGMTQMGGHAIYLGPADIGLNTREPASDIAKVTSRMGDIIMARTFNHSTIEQLAIGSSVPVINGLSDAEHPCQILADLLTILEFKKKLKGLTVAYVGDAENNVTHSLALAAKILGMNFRVGAPKGYWMDRKVIGKTSAFETTEPKEAVKGADVVITDTWVSMGDEAEKQKRIKLFQSYQVTKQLMKLAKPDAIFMHCLPAYRGNEVAAEVIDGPQSVVYDEAENRLHAQKALILFLLG